MPVIADTDEPPAKCCKYCEESTQGVDGGPASWRLTLDQDLIDTLKGNFPTWFQNTTTTITTNSKSNQVTTTTILNNNNNCISPITIDTKSHHHHHHSHQQASNSSNNTLQLQQLNGNVSILSCSPTSTLLSSASSLSASPASSIASNSSKKSHSSCTSSCSSASSVSSSSSSTSSSASASSSSSSSSTTSSLTSDGTNGKQCTGKSSITTTTSSTTAAAPTTTLAKTASAKCHSSNGNSGHSGISPTKSLSKTLKATAKPKPLSKSASLHSLGSGSGSSGGSLLATISSPLSTIELISDSSGLLTATQLCGKAFEHTFQDIILLHEAYDDMSEGEQRLHASFLGSSDDGNNSDFYDPRQSPPKAIVDSSPLQPAMDKNKESLKVKLMVRRPHSQLVEQGIIPSLKTSPAIHEQCKQLERAKTSDLLKAKIQQRPNREDLERLHILEEDECHIDPSLAEKQRMLKKARLADQLNSQIQHRPGPLELIKKNILHTEKPIEKIVKEGLVSFKATSEGLLTRPQHPHSYVTFEEDSQSSESDTRQTPPRAEEHLLAVPTSVSTGVGAAASVSVSSSGTDVLQEAAASAGIVTVAMTIPTSAGPAVVPSSELMQNKFPVAQVKPSLIPPPPPPPPTATTTTLPQTHGTDVSFLKSGGFLRAKPEMTYEELCQSVAGPTLSPSGANFLPMISSPGSLASTTSTLSPLSSIASPPQTFTPRPTPALLPIGKSDAPGKDKNRKKSKSKPVSKTRTIKFHEYKGPPSAAGQKQDNTVPEETSYQLMLEQQNCLLKFLETLNKNQSIIPASTAASGSSNSSSATSAMTTAVAGNTSVSNTTTVTKTVPTVAAQSTVNVPGAPNTFTFSCNASNVLTAESNQTTTTTSSSAGLCNMSAPSPGGSTLSIMSTPRPPPLPSPAMSVCSSIPPSPATSYAESTASSINDVTRLEKMKVSDLKLQLKKRNLPVSGPKPQLIERLKPYLPLDMLDCSTVVNTPVSAVSATEVITITDAMDTNTCPMPDAGAQTMSILVGNSPASMSPERLSMEQEQMDVVQQIESSHPVALQTIMQPQPQIATIMLSNEELLREQQRKIDELQRQLQRSQLELQQIRKKQQQQQQQKHPHTVNTQMVNALPTQQITLITTTTNGSAPQALTMLPTMKESLIPAKLTLQTKTQVQSQSKMNGIVTQPTSSSATAKKNNANNNNNNNSNNNGNANAVTQNNNVLGTVTATPALSQKMVVKQQLEAKIQKQKQAAAAAAAAAQAQAQAQQQHQQQVMLLTQTTQTVLIPTTTATLAQTGTVTTSVTNGNNTKSNTKSGEKSTAATGGRHAKNSANANSSKVTHNNNTTSSNNNKMQHLNSAAAIATTGAGSTTTATILANQLPINAKQHNNLGLVWNEGNQTIVLVGLNDQHMTAHTIGNISIANASAPTKKVLNGHQRTNSLPSIVFPITTAQAAEQQRHQQQHQHHQLIEAKSVITAQQLQQLQMQQQQQLHQQFQPTLIQAGQQIIQLDIKPTNLPQLQPPPPQYEEATKQLAATKAAGALNIVPLVKIKEEVGVQQPTTGNTSTATAAAASTQTQSKRKARVKCEKLNDVVLDMLSNQSDMSKSALEPLTPLTSGGSNMLMTDMSGNLIFTTTSGGGATSITPIVSKMEPLTPLALNAAHDMAMDTTPHSGECSYAAAHQTQTTPATASTNSFIENIDMASPMQPATHIVDAESVAKTLDIFLEQQHHNQQTAAAVTAARINSQSQQQQQSPTHHDMLSKRTHDSEVEKSLQHATSHSPDDAKLNPFDEFELLELMSQQLEMDIGDDSNNYCSANNRELKSGSSNGSCVLRDMNPSLQPAINDLLDGGANAAHVMGGLLNSNNNGSQHAASDVDFDAESFVAQLSQHSMGSSSNNSSIIGVASIGNVSRSLDSGNGNGNGSASCTGNNNQILLCTTSNASSHSTNGNDFGSGDSSQNASSQHNHYGSTPMDVCDDFEHTLNSFNFATLSPDANINTPPHPFGGGGGGGIVSNGLGIATTTTSCGMQAVTQPQTLAVEQMSICGGGPMSTNAAAAAACANANGVDTSAAVDAFNSSGDIFDLFNMDDYKMSWAGGDFAV